MARLGFGGAEVWGGGVEGGEDGGGEGREGEGGGAGGCSEECHRALEWRGEVKVQPSLSPPFGSRFTSPQWSPHTPPDRTAIPGHCHFPCLCPPPAPGEIPPFGHARLWMAHYYVSGLRDMTSFDCAHLSQSGTRFQATFPRRCPSTRFSGFGTNNPRS